MSASRAKPASAADLGRHLLDLDQVSGEQIRSLLASTRRFAQAPASQRFNTLEGRIVANLFFEVSTRTRLSFTIAARRLGADVVDLGATGSSVSKGETIADTARTVEAMGAEALVVRQSAPGGAQLVAGAVDCAVLNAGDGRHAHPTQGLLDAYVVAEAHGRLDGFDLTGLRIGIVGDLVNSRVARSDLGALTKLGAAVVCVGPPNLAPASFGALGCDVTADLDTALPTLDAVQILRVQFERGAEVGSPNHYAEHYQLDDRRLGLLKPSAVVLHPGPLNRGVEISSGVADSDRSKILRQVQVGVCVRMAAFEACVAAI